VYRIALSVGENLLYITDDNRVRDHRLCRNERGEIMEWQSFQEAIDYLNANFRRELIDPDHVTPNHPDFRRAADAAREDAE
jgi:hypothetical protein